MKSILTLLLLMCLATVPSYSSHVVGGEISWQCLTNGKFVFEMIIYRDCSGIPWAYQNETLSINGSPLPTNGVTSILMKPNNPRFFANRNGETSPLCTGQYGSALSCSNGDLGTIQRFFYQSDPVTLTGVPPSTGWDFYYTAACCRPGNLENVITSGSMMLRVTMFPNASNSLVDTCYDSSPIFTDLPQLQFCRNQAISYNHFVRDADLDSIAIKWGRPINPPITAPQQLNYKTGYSLTNPTPDATFNASNQASFLNPETGDISLAVYSGVGVKKYAMVNEVESWRDGQLIARVSREIPISFYNCAPLPSGDTNRAPIFNVSLPQDSNGVYRDTVVAGSFVSYSLSVSDLDSTGIGSGKQIVHLQPSGQSFSLSYAASNFCQSPGDSSCATLTPAPVNNGAHFRLSDSVNVSSTFNWQTNCSHLTEDSLARTHVFNFRYYDDHCSVPAFNYSSIAITVLPSTNNCNLITGIKEGAINFQDNVHLFPNPTSGQFNIRINKEYQKLHMGIRNIHGQLVYEKNYLNQNDVLVNIESESGVYFVTITNEKGEQANMKVVKH